MNRFMLIAMALIIAAVIILSCRGVLAQSPIAVKMTDSDQAGILTPKALAALTGETWQAGGNYFIEVDSRRCQIVAVNAEAILFIVAADVRPSEAGRIPRTLYVQGPQMSRFLDVLVVPYYPMVRRQSKAPDERPECCAVAIIAPRIFPEFYIGEPIPTNENILPMSVLSSGILTGRYALEYPFVPLLRLTNAEGRYIEVEAEAFSFPLLGPEERVQFVLPACFDGEWLATVRYGSRVSRGGLLRFASNCASAPRIPTRKVREN